jgi:UDP-3-O-[3-hydroxymyristoyl] glucosamine N-acyltransferase
MWSGNHVGHLSRISDHCFLSSHVVISGNSSVGEYSFLGVNSAISDNIAVAENNIVGMGAVISRNTEPDCIYTGNPASKSSVSAKKFAKVRL